MASTHQNSKVFKRSSLIMLVVAILLLISKYGPAWSTLSQEGTITLVLMLIMAILWMTEPIPIYVTALIPIVIFPLFQVDNIATVTANYGNHNIYLFFGGFVLALAIEHTGLHRRLALNILKAVGTKPSNIIAGFIIAPGFLSMWISNTATTVLMLPVAFSILTLLKETLDSKQFKSMTIAILFSIAFSSSMGGMTTLVGTPPNAILAAFAKDQGFDIGFGQFMIIGLPISLGGFLILWFLFTKILFKLGKRPIEGAKELLDKELKEISKMTTPEKRVLIIFVLTAFLWIFRKLISKYVFGHIGISLSDPGISMFAAVSLFVVSNGQGERIMTWKNMKNLPWGILLLFGGGLALGQQVKKTGVGTWIAEGLQPILSETPLLLIVALIVFTVIILSQFASNTATTAAFLPIFFPLAQATNIHPLFIMLPLTLGASAVFILPSATPPNAIVMSGEGLEVKDMIKYGSVVNIVFAVFLIFAIYGLLHLNIAFDIGDGMFPS